MKFKSFYVNRILDGFLNQKLDAHVIKREVLEKNVPICQHNLFYDKTTGTIVILKKC